MPAFLASFNGSATAEQSMPWVTIASGFCAIAWRIEPAYLAGLLSASMMVHVQPMASHASCMPTTVTADEALFMPLGTSTTDFPTAAGRGSASGRTLVPLAAASTTRLASARTAAASSVDVDFASLPAESSAHPLRASARATRPTARWGKR